MVITFKKIDKLIIKTLLCTTIFLALAILCKKNTTYKEKIYNELYENHISFSYFKKIYNHYLGGIIPLENITKTKTQAVFNEKIIYKKMTPYKNGALLEVENNYLVPSEQEGIIVYIGEKEDYGNVIIIEDKDNVDIWYGNICNSTLKLYDYVEKGNYIGQSCDEKIYLIYSKDNNFLNYKDYLS